MSEVTFRKLAAMYLPMAVVVAALAVFIAVAPSKVLTNGSHAPGTGPGEVVAGAGTASNAPGGSSGGGPTGALGTQGTTPTGTSESRNNARGGGGALDCGRQKILGVTGGPTCKPFWQGGSNGGATYAGVTATTVNVVIFYPQFNQQEADALTVAGRASPDDYTAVIPGYEKFFNAYFQAYGRHVKLIFQVGPNATDNASGDQANADVAARQTHAFAVSTSAGTPAFHNELARLHVPSVDTTLALSYPEAEKVAPYVFSILANQELYMAQLAEYYCKRLNGRPAKFAGDPVYQSSTRKLGIVYPEGYDQLVQFLSSDLSQGCKGTITKAVSYSPDITIAAQQATNIAAAMKNAGVTTASCLCDALAPAYFTNAAADQAWVPEWLENGIDTTDSYQAGRLYNQAEWAHAFGPSALGYPELLADTAWWKAYYTVEPPGTNSDSLKRVGPALFPHLLDVLLGIEAAGPSLTARSFADGLLNLPPLGGGPKPIKAFGWSFKPIPPYSPYSQNKNFTEIWWCPNCTGPDGKPGFNYYVQGGKRYLVGQWPSTDPNVMTSDGSAQPPRDPNA